MSRITALFAACALTLTSGWVLAGDYWPHGRDWESISPDDTGAYVKKLKAATDFAMADGSQSLIVLRDGRMVIESYATPYDRESRHEIYSAAKSVLAILVGTALVDRKIKSLDQSASDFIPTWKGTEKEKITIRHLLTMTSGLRQRGLQVRNIQGDQFALNVATPLDHEPGKFWEYNTPAYHLLFHIIAKATNENFETYAQRRLVSPLGLENWSWVKNQGKGANKPVNYYSAEGSARDMARIGLLMLRQGQWNGRQLLPTRFVRMATSPSQELNPAYGLLWWVNGDQGRSRALTPQNGAPTGPATGPRFPSLPANMFAALGHQNQDILVVPSQNLVVVRQGAAPRDPAFAAKLLKQVVDSIKPAAQPGTTTP